MKNLYTLLLSIIALTAFSQAPQLINYQGIARSGNGNPIISVPLALRFEILQGSASGSVVFTEDQAGVQANDLGLFSTQIGKTNALPASWANGPYYLRVGIDTLNSTNFATVGSPQQIASVPFALSAPAPSLSYGGGVLTVGDKTVPITASGSAQTLAITNNSLTISSGNTVVLPSTSLTASGGGITVTPTGNNAYNLNVTSAVGGSVALNEFRPGGTSSLVGILQIAGTYPNYTLAVAPDIQYNQNTGYLILSNNSLWASIAGMTSTYVTQIYVTPSITVTNGILRSGPPTNSVDFNPFTPWRVAAGTNSVACASTSYSYSIGTFTPQANLHVDGFTKLGITAPAMQVMTFTGTTGGAANSAVNLPLPSYTLQGTSTQITPAKIISVSVLVNAGSGEWIPAGYAAATPINCTYYWHIASSGNNIVITNGATAFSNIAGQTAKVTITYTQ